MSLWGCILVDQAVPAGPGCSTQPASPGCLTGACCGLHQQQSQHQEPEPLCPGGHGDVPAAHSARGALLHCQHQDWQRECVQRSPGAASPPAQTQLLCPGGRCLPAAWPFRGTRENVALIRSLSLLICLWNLQLLSPILCQHKTVRNTGGSPRTAKAASAMLWEALAGTF